MRYLVICEDSVLYKSDEITGQMRDMVVMGTASIIDTKHMEDLMQNPNIDEWESIEVWEDFT